MQQPRIKLQELLNKQIKAKLIFLSAPAGYGKTSLISLWLETTQQTHQWLTFDNHSSSADFSLAQLIKKISQSPQVVVLDNYHWAECAETNTALQELFNERDSSVVFIVISRHLPPPSWSYLFAQENSLLLQQEDLAFSKQEVDLLFTQSPLQQLLSLEEWHELSSDYYYFLQGWPAVTQLFFNLALPHERAKKYFFPTLPQPVIDFIMQALENEIGGETNFFLTHPLLKCFRAQMKPEEKPEEKNYGALLAHLAYRQEWLSCIEILAAYPIDFYAPEIEIFLDWIITQITIQDLSSYPKLLYKLNLYYFSRQEEKYNSLIASKEFNFELKTDTENSIELFFYQSIILLKKGELKEAQENIHALISESIRSQRTMPLLRGLILLSKICQLTNDYSDLLQALQFSSSSASMKDSHLLRLSQIAILPYHLANGELKEAQELLKDIRLCLDQENQLKTALIEEEWALCQKKLQQSHYLKIKKTPPRAHIISSLSKREQEILQLIAKGLTNEEIAEKLQRSRGTIKLHAHHIYEKLSVSNRIEATQLFQEYLLIKK